MRRVDCRRGGVVAVEEVPWNELKASFLLREFSYSFRSATIGSIHDALRAGTYPATSAATNKMATAVPRAHGSFRFMSNRNDSTSFDAVSAAGTLTATPIPT